SARNSLSRSARRRVAQAHGVDAERSARLERPAHDPLGIATDRGGDDGARLGPPDAASVSARGTDRSDNEEIEANEDREENEAATHEALRGVPAKISRPSAAACRTSASAMRWTPRLRD